MAKTADTKVPKRVTGLLKKDYLEEDEEIIEIIHEAYIPRIDFRWLILTNKRIIQATKKLVEVQFQSLPLDGMSLRLTRGWFFDALEVQQMVTKYRATMYAFDRAYTIDFISQVRNAMQKFGAGKQKEMSEVALQPIQALENLIELKQKGEISEKEYQKIKTEILENMKKE